MGEGRLWPDRRCSSSLSRMTSHFSCPKARSNLIVGQAMMSNSFPMRSWQAERPQYINSPQHPQTHLQDQMTLETAHLPPTDHSIPRLRSEKEPFLNSSASLTCEPHDLSLHCAYATDGPELRGTDTYPTSIENKDSHEWSLIQLEYHNPE